MSPTPLPLDAVQEQMWTLAGDCRSVHMTLPPFPVAGMPEPLTVHVEFDTRTIDEILQRLSALRVQMLPPLPRN
ncbi:MAG TPA: hypothetical protein VEC60_15425 [Reyranella sp.]|nr:hypothetical protein [Reyranella sp.]